MMARSFRELRKGISPERRERNQRNADAIIRSLIHYNQILLTMRLIRHTVPILLCLILVSSAVRAQGSSEYRYDISVVQNGQSLGKIRIELFPGVAPLTVRNFDSLVAIGFYDRTAFHRVLPTSIIQGGDPNSRDGDEETWGFGDPSQRNIPAEFSDLKHSRGVISMARRGNDTNSGTSQFFICVANRYDLDRRYTIFGHVLEGMDVVDAIANTPHNEFDRPTQKIEMTITKLDVTGGITSPVASRGGVTAFTAPNPCGDHLNISYTLPCPARVDISLFDAMGRRVSAFSEGMRETGPHAARCDMSALPAGMYAWRLNVDGEWIGGMVLKAR